jgi:1,4-dihydroxy-2-naphthoyl-CoA hydrolase
VIATAIPVHRGRRTQVWQTRLETEEGKLVAVVTQTQMVLV